MTEVQEITRYFIDPRWYQGQGRSFPVVAQARFCRSCQNRIGTETEEQSPTIDPRTGRVVFESRKVPFGANPSSVIRACCSKERDYITPETPVLEAVFRVLLANGNQPSSLESLREQLGYWIPLNSRPHGYSTDLMRRLIEADDHYGIREFQLIMV